jgi:hypothetical protein
MKKHGAVTLVIFLVVIAPCMLAQTKQTNRQAAPSGCVVIAGDGPAGGGYSCPVANNSTLSAPAPPISTQPISSQPVSSLPTSVNSSVSLDTGRSAYASGALSVADFNVSKRSEMVSGLEKGWQSPAQQQEAPDTLASTTHLSNPFDSPDRCTSGIPGDGPARRSISSGCGGQERGVTARDSGDSSATDRLLKVMQLIVEVGDKWAVTRGVKDITEPFNMLSYTLTRAGITAGGQNAICPIEAVNTLSQYVNTQADFLSTLASKSENYWLDASGMNSFDRSTVPSAQGYLDGWYDRLTHVNLLIQEMVPMVKTSQDVLSNPGVLAALEYKGHMTDVYGCADELGSIVPLLNSASANIEKVNANLSSARSLIY